MEGEFRLAQKHGDATLRDHLIVAWRATGKMPEELDLPDIPECVAELWATFLALHAARPAGAFAPSPIGYGTIRDYCTMMHVTLSPWEVETLVEIDRAALRALAEK